MMRTLGPDDKVLVAIDYTNHRGERARRIVVPKAIFYGDTKWHPGPMQWFLLAEDCEKNAERSFAMKDIHSWTPHSEPGTPGVGLPDGAQR